jgi:F-type H+-transporting ATPase subunit b
MQAANAETAASIEAAEGRIRSATEAALAELERVAAEAARDMAQRLAGIDVTEQEAAAAVKASNG